MADQVELAYDAGQHRAVITLRNGRSLTLKNVSEEQAKAFVTRHDQKFKRDGYGWDGVLDSVGTVLTRDGNG